MFQCDQTTIGAALKIVGSEEVAQSPQERVHFILRGKYKKDRLVHKKRDGWASIDIGLDLLPRHRDYDSVPACLVAR
jgi:hypothetical protein